MKTHEKLPPATYLLRLRTLLELAAPRIVSQPESCIAFALQARALALSQGDQREAATLLSLIARAARNLDQYGRALRMLRRAVKELPEASTGWAELGLLEYYIANAAYRSGNIARAVRYGRLSAIHRRIAAALESGDIAFKNQQNDMANSMDTFVERVQRENK